MDEKIASILQVGRKEVAAKEAEEIRAREAETQAWEMEWENFFDDLKLFLPEDIRGYAHFTRQDFPVRPMLAFIYRARVEIDGLAPFKVRLSSPDFDGQRDIAYCLPGVSPTGEYQFYYTEDAAVADLPIALAYAERLHQEANILAKDYAQWFENNEKVNAEPQYVAVGDEAQTGPINETWLRDFVRQVIKDCE